MAEIKSEEKIMLKPMIINVAEVNFQLDEGQNKNKIPAEIKSAPEIRPSSKLKNL